MRPTISIWIQWRKIAARIVLVLLVCWSPLLSFCPCPWRCSARATCYALLQRCDSRCCCTQLMCQCCVANGKLCHCLSVCCRRCGQICERFRMLLLHFVPLCGVCMSSSHAVCSVSFWRWCPWLDSDFSELSCKKCLESFARFVCRVLLEPLLDAIVIDPGVIHHREGNTHNTTHL